MSQFPSDPLDLDLHNFTRDIPPGTIISSESTRPTGPSGYSRGHLYRWTGAEANEWNTERVILTGHAPPVAGDARKATVHTGS